MNSLFDRLKTLGKKTSNSRGAQIPKSTSKEVIGSYETKNASPLPMLKQIADDMDAKDSGDKPTNSTKATKSEDISRGNLIRERSIARLGSDKEGVASAQVSPPTRTKSLQNITKSKSASGFNLVVQEPTDEDDKAESPHIKKYTPAGRGVGADGALTPSTSSAAILQMEALQVLNTTGYLSFPKKSGFPDDYEFLSYEAHPTLLNDNPLMNASSYDNIKIAKSRSEVKLSQEKHSSKSLAESSKTGKSKSKIDMPIQVPPLPDDHIALIKANKSLALKSTMYTPVVHNNIQQAIEYHQELKLKEAFRIYLKVAQEKVPIALFLVALCLRHGWGCKADPQLALSCFEHAADMAAGSLRQIRGFSGSPEDAKNLAELPPDVRLKAEIAKQEMSMSLYELGNSYRLGWGTNVQKSVAVYYYKLAADLGDLDALMDLAYCHTHGEGTEKDKFLGASYYRIAALQGRIEFGSAWIYKYKYTQFFRNNFPTEAAAEAAQFKAEDREVLLEPPVKKDRKFKLFPFVQR
ncbi:hypothetical protein MP638_003761 [Amoeboaphelidium occidentale]|nr:hypothetical protein MP638_003761 [Amoeboaphelidium occidentale]